MLRHTAGSISTTIVGALGLAGWPELVHWLLGSLGSGAAAEGPALDGALDSLSKVVEDHPHQVCVRVWEPGVSCLLAEFNVCLVAALTG